MTDVQKLTVDLLRTPYREGGRQLGVGIDCLGVVLVVAQALGLPAPDPWPSIEAAWRTGRLDLASGFPAGWSRIMGARLQDLREGDVLLFFGVHPWSAIVWSGHVWSADAYVGAPYCRPLARWVKEPEEVWRYGSQGLGAQRPAR